MIGLLGIVVAAMLQTTVPPTRSLDKGAQSDVSSPRQVAIRDADAWKALWSQHAAGRPLPAVDFGREMVVAVFMGTKSTGGFAVEIAGYRESGGDVVVQYRESSPGRGAITAQVLTSPYHLVAIPKRAGAVTFEKISG